ncbi:hypothetical protein [Escherichia coli]|uniref:hypothetical protein n=1 Tax=Escherichia coli TaxID=562 RepID=UPI0039A1E5AE
MLFVSIMNHTTAYRDGAGIWTIALQILRHPGDKTEQIKTEEQLGQRVYRRKCGCRSFSPAPTAVTGQN